MKLSQKPLIIKIRLILKEISAAQVGVHAANASFFILFAAVPSMILLLTLLQFLPITVSDLSDTMSGFAPSAVINLALMISADLSTHTVTVVSASAVAILWAAGRGVLGLITGLNAVNHVTETRNYFLQRGICMLYMLLILAALLLTLLLHVFGRYLQTLLIELLPEMAASFAAALDLRYLFSFVILTCLFTLILTVFPDRRPKLKYTFPAAFLTAAGWLIFSGLFSIYINHFCNYATVYGSVATLLLVMLWIYFCMYILLCGGLLASMLERDAFPFFRRKSC